MIHITLSWFNRCFYFNLKEFTLSTRWTLGHSIKRTKRVAKLIDSILYFLNCEYSSENPIGLWVGKQIIF